MSVVDFKKVEIVLHKEIEEDLFRKIQALGVVELISLKDDDDGERAVSDKEIKQKENLLADIRFVLKFLEPYDPKKESLIEKIIGPQQVFKVSEIEKRFEEENLLQKVKEVREVERNLSELNSSISNLQTEQDLLQKLSSIKYPLFIFKEGTQNIKGLLGIVDAKELDSLKEELSKNIRYYDFCQGLQDEKGVYFGVVYHRDEESKVKEVLSVFNITYIEITERSGLPTEEIQSIEKEINELKSKLEQIKTEIVQKYVNYIDLFKVAFDYYSVLLDRLKVKASSIFTNYTVIARGWLPVIALEEFNKVIKDFEGLAIAFIKDPQKGDKPPTLLKNNRYVAPFEPLVKLYGVPQYGELDPSPLIAPFFALFFGMCLSDAGYGAVIALLTWLFLRKYPIVGDSRKFLTLLLISGSSTVIVGALFGSWFGNFIDVMPIISVLKPVKDLFVVIDPMKNPITVLVVALIFGVIQVLFGVLVSFYDKLRKKQILEGIYDDLSWFMLVVGLLIMGLIKAGYSAGPFTLLDGQILAILGAGIIILTKGRNEKNILKRLVTGIVGLYDITGYLSDVLSYSRLLALGMATAAVAMIVNTLAVLVMDIPFVGIVIAIVILLVGHTFSLLVNSLGAFVHSTRLQYVEFFSKFYKGGGKPFEPFSYKTKYIKISE